MKSGIRLSALVLTIICIVSFGNGVVTAAPKAAKEKAAEKATPSAGAEQKTAEKPAASAEQPAAAPSGQYKIGVVNRKEVLKSYKKVEAEYKELQNQVNVLQADIDKLSTKIQTAKDTYEKEKEKMTSAERAERENAIQGDYRQYQAELSTKQADIDSKEKLLIKKAMTDIDDAVKKIGAEENYHLILEGSGVSGAIYYAPRIDITPRVIEILNSKP